MNKIVKAGLAIIGGVATAALVYSVISERKLEKELAKEYELDLNTNNDTPFDDFSDLDCDEDYDDLDCDEDYDDLDCDEDCDDLDCDEEDDAFECNFDDEMPVQAEI